MSKKKNVFFIAVVIIGIGGASLYYFKDNREALPSFISTKINTYKTEKKYIIQKAGQIVESADTIDEAKEKAKDIKRSIVVNTYNNEWVYCDIKPYFIVTEKAVHDFKSFIEAYAYAKQNDYTQISYRNNTEIIWKSEHILQKKKIDVPLILQYPELPRGCEVTSLAMLLQYRGINVSKMTLAKEVNKDTTQYYIDEKKRIHYGNPYDGFVGDMYDAKKNGYGVYHGPIAELAQKYKSNETIDLTGIEFEDMLYFVEQGNPVWIITNSTYRSLDDSYFEIWHTPTGIVKTTKKLHSVLITGFDHNNVYINDPLYNQANRPLNRENFKSAWEQMGNQAITIID